MAERKSVDRVNHQEPSDAPSRARKWLRAAVFFAGSAAFGGLAVALWDRKTLTAMRGKSVDHPAAPKGREEDIY
jgi:hypothetical protein